MSDTIELTDRQRERIETIKDECSDELTPDPEDREILSSLLDTWEAVNDGYYTENSIEELQGAYLEGFELGRNVEELSDKSIRTAENKFTRWYNRNHE